MELEYKAIPEENELSERNFDSYLIKKDVDKIVKAIVINPFEETLKSINRKEFDFGRFSVTRGEHEASSVSWKNVYDYLHTFLEIRADDSRASRIAGLRKFEGVGYCIRFDKLLEEIEKIKKENTNNSEYVKLTWPRRKKDEKFLMRIVFPKRDYSKKTDENAKICLEAKRFCGGLEKEVKTAYYNNSRAWFKNQTGFVWYTEKSKKKKSILPSKNESPVDRERVIGAGRHIYIVLSRKEEPVYDKIVNGLIKDLERVKDGEVVDYIRNPQDARDFVCITSLLKRIDLDTIKEDKSLFKQHFNVSGKYVISPS